MSVVSVALRVAVRLMVVVGAFSSAAAAADLDVIVNRHDGTIELFVSTPAENFVSVFGLPAERLVEPDGTVDFAPLRANGTFEMADEMIATTSATLDGTPMVFEGLSLMLHPLDEKQPFGTPFEAFLAIAVCTFNDPATRLTLQQLHGYAGFIADVGDIDGMVRLRLPRTGHDELRVLVRDFRSGAAALPYEVRVGDGKAFEIRGDFSTPLSWLWVLLLLSGALGAGVALRLRRIGSTGASAVRRGPVSGATTAPR